MVLKTLDLLSSRRDLEVGGVEAGGTGGGGGRKSRLDLALSFSCVDSIQVSQNIELQEDDDSDSRRKSVKYVDHSVWTPFSQCFECAVTIAHKG